MSQHRMQLHRFTLHVDILASLTSKPGVSNSGMHARNKGSTSAPEQDSALALSNVAPISANQGRLVLQPITWPGLLRPPFQACLFDQLPWPSRVANQRLGELLSLLGPGCSRLDQRS